MNKLKFVLLTTCLFAILCGCETKQDIEKRKEQERIDSIVANVSQSDINENAKNWMIDVKSKKVVTVLCITTSKKCSKLNETLPEVLNGTNITSYFFNVDELEAEELNYYKTTFDLPKYTGYLPYLYITNNDNLVNYAYDIYSKEELDNFINYDKVKKTDNKTIKDNSTYITNITNKTNITNN